MWSSTDSTSSSSSTSECGGGSEAPSAPTVKRRLSRTVTPFSERPLKSDAPWHKMIENNVKGMNSIHDETTRDGKFFRRRFRIPFALYYELVKAMIDEGWFSGFGPHGEGMLDATKTERNRGASLWVKVLSVLRVLGRGVVFDECFDGSGCSESMIQTFFHQFLRVFSSRLLHCAVCPPQNSEELRTQLKIYERLGLNGAFGSTDVTHFPLGKCPRSYGNMCTGKTGKPTLAYSMTCSHARRIYHCTSGFPGSKNDKTISKFETLLDDVGKKAFYTEEKWNMYTAEGEVVRRKGVYLICDGKHLPPPPPLQF
jgi:hypothetical protein